MKFQTLIVFKILKRYNYYVYRYRSTWSSMYVYFLFEINQFKNYSKSFVDVRFSIPVALHFRYVRLHHHFQKHKRKLCYNITSLGFYQTFFMVSSHKSITFIMKKLFIKFNKCYIYRNPLPSRTCSYCRSSGLRTCS